MGATLYIDPLLGPINPKKFMKGQFLNHKPHLEVVWPNMDPLPKNANAHIGMTNLTTLMTANQGSSGDPTNIIGHSGGSQIAMKWLREIGPTSPLPKGNYHFWLAGSPEQKYTGASYLYPAQSPPVYPGDPANGAPAHDGSCPTPLANHGGYGIGSGLPATCPWHVNVISNQYDGWSDAPNSSWATNAELSRKYGSIAFFIPQYVWNHSPICLMKSLSGPHDAVEYETHSIADTGTQVYTDPANATVKYYYIPTYPFPSINKVKWITWLARNLDMARRPVVEAAYTHRPVTMPTPDYSAVPTWFGV